MTARHFVLTASSVLGFFAKDRAKAAAGKLPNSVLVSSEEDLMAVPGAQLVGIYNDHSDKPVKKFRDSKTAATRVFPILPEVAVVPEAETDAATPKAKTYKMEITEGSHALLMALWEDRENWSGQPLFGGNVGGDKASEGHLTDLKKLGLVETHEDENPTTGKPDMFVTFLKHVDDVEFTIKKAGKAKPSGKGKAKPATSKSGKVAQWTGQKVKRTQRGMEAKRREDTRRTQSWVAIEDGMTYEECLKAGALAADLDKMFRLGHITWK